MKKIINLIRFGLPVFLAVFISVTAVYAQDSRSETSAQKEVLSEKEYRQLQEDLEYKNFGKREQQKIEPYNLPGFELSPALTAVLKVLLWALGIGGLLFILFVLINRYFDLNASADDEEEMSFWSEDIQRISWSDLRNKLEKALAEKDYRTAVRYHFLIAIKMLVSKKILVWKRDKTDRDFQYELRRKFPEFEKEFSKLCVLFQEARYSEHTIDADYYQTAQSLFSGFEAKIENTETAEEPVTE